MSALWIALAVAISSTAGPLLLARQLNRQRRVAASEKAEDRKREDNVAAEALRQQEEVRVEDLRSKKEIADTAEQAAALLLQAQKSAAAGTAEVAKQLAGEASAVAHAYGIPVVISYVETGQRDEVMLSNVPRIGEHVRMRNGPGAPSVIVEDVVWMEAFLPPPNPSVIVVVRQQSAVERDEAAKQRRQRT